MHQHPRSPAPASAGRSNASRAEDRREQGFGLNAPSLDPRPPSGRGLGIETDPDAAEHAHPPQPSKDVMAKLNQIISNYHTKAALIILHSRVDLPPSFAKGSESPKVNRWFNVEIDETDVLREQLRTWRACDATDNRPPPLIIETYLDTKGLTNNQSLVVLDENGKRWDVLESLAASEGPQPVRPPSARSDDVILERWRIELGETPNQLPTDLGSILPTVYKKSIVLFRSLFTYSKFLPAWKFKRNGRLRANPVLRIKYRILNGQAAQESSAQPDHLTAPLYEGSGKVVDNYSFGVTDSPAGPFSVQVTYRTTCDFRVDDSEALLSSRFMGADDEIFRPSLPTRESTLKAPPAPAHEIGSAPLEKRSLENPDPSQAYGSLSTFHQVGPTTSTSPISALRAARDAGAVSPSPPGPSARPPVPVARASPAGRAATLANEASPGVARRPSISFQPFKAPPLSASPSLTDPPLGGSPRSAPVPRVEPRNMPPPSSAAAARRTLPTAADNPIAASNSASPRGAPISRYSSAFSHRRGRLSLGGGPIRMSDDDASSGKASATSSAQPGSGLLAEATGTSADSIHADDENISEFLKMLDLRKDLMSPSNNPAALEASARRTTATSAALARFQRMRDSNAALSDSMSSSLLLQRSSNSSSKQLSGVPPMVGGTSVSTASSPGKPISPHTPHTPAIPSRLSSNSIVDYNNAGDPHVERGSPDENPSDQTSVIPIDIPTSPPRLFPPPFRRSSSAAHRPPPAPSDEDDIFPFNMRSISLGAEDRSNVSLSVLQRQHEYESATATAGQSPRDQHPSSAHDEGPGSHTGASEGSSSHRGSGPSATPHHVYQSRFGNYRCRGSSGAPHSFSSGSGSLARGAMHPPYLAERFEIDRDATGSGSNSGTSTMEGRGTGRRSSAGRHVPPPSTQQDDDENLLFAMSDYSASRRSLEEGRHFNPGPSRRF